MIQENNTHKNNTSQQGKVEPKHFTVTSTPAAADDRDNNHQHVNMIFLKHVIQTRNGQEEINPLTLALLLPLHHPFNNRTEISPPCPNENTRITRPPSFLNSSWGCKMYNCLS